MKMKLKLALIELRVSQYEVARDIGMTETRFSRIVTGRLSATQEERAMIARRLRTTAAALFGDDHEDAIKSC